MKLCQVLPNFSPWVCTPSHSREEMVLSGRVFGKEWNGDGDRRRTLLQSFTNFFPVQVCSVVKSRLPRMFSPKLAVLPSGSYSWPDPKTGDPNSVGHSQETSFGL